MINRCIGCYHYDCKENVCIHGSPIFIDDECTDYQDNDFIKQIMTKTIDECADLFSNILSNMPNVCGINCPVKCNWGTEESCKDMCKKWFLEQLEERINERLL